MELLKVPVNREMSAGKENIGRADRLVAASLKSAKAFWLEDCSIER